MAAAFSPDQVAAIAALANLELEPSEVDLFSRQIGDILAYADAVLQVDTTGVPPTASVIRGHAVDRADDARPSLDLEEVLANAPDPARDAGYFRVPRVIG